MKLYYEKIKMQKAHKLNVFVGVKIQLSSIWLVCCGWFKKKKKLGSQVINKKKSN